MMCPSTSSDTAPLRVEKLRTSTGYLPQRVRQQKCNSHSIRGGVPETAHKYRELCHTAQGGKDMDAKALTLSSAMNSPKPPRGCAHELEGNTKECAPRNMEILCVAPMYPDQTAWHQTAATHRKSGKSPTDILVF